MSDRLELIGLSKRFGEIVACDDVTLTFEPGSCTAIVGPNGAGKTTSMNLIAGALQPDAGRIVWRGRDLVGLPTHRIARLGVSRLFQDLKLFGSMTVWENLQSALPARADLAFAEDVLDRIGLRAHANRRGAELSYAERKLTAFGRTICAQGGLIMLDEPASGLDGASLGVVLDLIAWLKARGCTLIVVEHNLSIVARIATRAILVELGRVVADGPPESVFNASEFGRIYFSFAA